MCCYLLAAIFISESIQFWPALSLHGLQRWPSCGSGGLHYWLIDWCMPLQETSSIGSHTLVLMFCKRLSHSRRFFTRPHANEKEST
jgi:hypothetical protein